MRGYMGNVNWGNDLGILGAAAGHIPDDVVDIAACVRSEQRKAGIQ